MGAPNYILLHYTLDILSALKCVHAEKCEEMRRNLSLKKEVDEELAVKKLKKTPPSILISAKWQCAIWNNPTHTETGPPRSRCIKVCCI